MMRRPPAIAAASFAAGIGAAGAAGGKEEAALLAAASAAGCALLFFGAAVLHNYLNKEYNNSTPEADASVDRSEVEHQEKPAASLLPPRANVRAAALLAAVFCALGILSGALSLSKQSQFSALWGQPAQLYGIITEARQDDDRVTLTLKLTDGERGKIAGSGFTQEKERIQVNVYKYNGPDPRLLTGCRASVRGTLKEPGKASNPGGFDYSRWLRSRRILSCMTCYGTGLETSVIVNKTAHSLAVFKTGFEERLRETMDPDAAGLLCGILFGDDTYLDPDVQENFRENGTGHLLAASGLHVGFVYGIVRWMFRKPRTAAGNLPVAAALIFYAALAGFSPSVTRAVIMVLISIVSDIAIRRYDMLNSISAAALILLIYNPAALFSAGFQLSFMAVITISVVTKPITDIFLPAKENIREMLPSDYARYRIKRDIIRDAAAAFAIQLGMMPVTLLSFHYISPAGFLLNAPSIALAGIIVPLGTVLIPLSFGPAALFGGAALMNEMLLKILMWINSLTEDGILGCIYLPSPRTGFFFFYYFMLFFLCGESGQRLIGFVLNRFCRQTFTFLLALLLAGGSVCAGAGLAADLDYLSGQMIFVDVGQGDCAHLKAGGKNLIFDSGGSKDRDVGKTVLMPYFLGNGVGTIDLAVISHLHTDHYAGLCSAAKYVHVKKLLVSKAYRSQLKDIVRDTGVAAENIIFAQAGDRIEMGGVKIEALAPFPRPPEEFAKIAADPDQENDCSLVTRVTYDGISYIFTGDIDESFEKKLVSSNSDKLSADILKVAHHGSRFSSCSSFLEAVRPAAAVIQVGHNNYGHPTPEAIERIEKAGAAIYRNDQQGAIMIRPARGGQIHIRTMK